MKAGKFLKKIKDKIYIWFAVNHLTKKLKKFQKAHVKCFQDMGERIYELKRDNSFELIDLAAINEYINEAKRINKEIEKIKGSLKEIKDKKA